MAAALPNISSDLIYQFTRNSNAFVLSGQTQDKKQFSSDPMNLKNINSRTLCGYANSKAVGVNPGPNNTVVVTRKKKDSDNKPSKSIYAINFSKQRSNRKIYKAVAGLTAKTGYRPDLRLLAIQRVSAIRKSQRPVKPSPPEKPRGKKTKKETQ